MRRASRDIQTAFLTATGQQYVAVQQHFDPLEGLAQVKLPITSQAFEPAIKLDRSLICMHAR